jgi:hypothetical protein
VPSEKTLLFLGDFDGEFGEPMAQLTKFAGPVLDAIFEHVESPPPSFVAGNVDAFVEWMSEQLINAANLYIAYLHVTVGDIKKLASTLSAAAVRLALEENSRLSREASEAVYFDFAGNATPDSKPVGRINRARWQAEVAYRKAHEKRSKIRRSQMTRPHRSSGGRHVYADPVDDSGRDHRFLRDVRVLHA